MVKYQRNFNLPKPECNRTGTGNKFNLICRSTVCPTVINWATSDTSRDFLCNVWMDEISNEKFSNCYFSDILYINDAGY